MSLVFYSYSKVLNNAFPKDNIFINWRSECWFINCLTMIYSIFNPAKAKDFSLGMKQRLMIAIALLGNPELLILDEPMNGLDPFGIKEVRDLLVKLHQEKHLTIVVSSHILDELSKIATRYGIIHNGKMVDEFSKEELEARCRQNLKFIVDDPRTALKLILKTVLQVRIILVDIFEKAIASEFMTKNPAKGATVIKGRQKERRVLTVDEQATFLKAIAGDWYEPLFCLALLTGLRQGELCALT